MLRNTGAAAAFGSILWLGGVAFGLSVSPHHQASHKSHAATGSDEKANDISKTETIDDRLAHYTLWLAIFTGVLSVSTIGLWLVTWRGGIRQSIDMQASIGIAERTLTELEAPIVYIKVVKTGITIDSMSNLFIFRRLSYRIVNCGRSPALLIQVSDNFTPVKRGGGFPASFRPAKARMGHGYYVPPGGESDDFNINLFGRFIFNADAPEDAILTELFLSVYVRYADIFEKSTIYEVGAMFMLDKAFDKFVLSSAGDAHNFHRKEVSDA